RRVRDGLRYWKKEDWPAVLALEALRPAPVYTSPERRAPEPSGVVLSPPCQEKPLPAPPGRLSVETSIPRFLWQASRSRELSEEALNCRDTWLEQNPGWYYRLMADAEMREFVHSTFGGEIAKVYDS